MTHRYNHEFESPDQGCRVFCVIEYEIDDPYSCAPRLGEYTREMHIVSVKALRIEGYDLDGHDIYMLFSEDLSEGWAQSLDLIADAVVREELDARTGLEDYLWDNAGLI
jgi:hypothetical protein